MIQTQVFEKYNSQAILNNFIEKNNEINITIKHEERDFQIGTYRASMSGYPIRKIYLHYTQPTNYNIKTKAIFYMDYSIHSLFEQAIQKTNLYVDHEQEISYKINSEITLIGHYDIKIKENNQYKLIDVKSCSKIPEYLYNTYPPQINVYFLMTNINKGYFTFIEKNRLITRDFEIEKDSYIINETIEKFKTVHEYLIEKKLPEPCPDFYCRFCQFKNYCYR